MPCSIGRRMPPIVLRDERDALRYGLAEDRVSTAHLPSSSFCFQSAALNAPTPSGSPGPNSPARFNGTTTGSKPAWRTSAEPISIALGSFAREQDRDALVRLVNHIGEVDRVKASQKVHARQQRLRIEPNAIRANRLPQRGAVSLVDRIRGVEHHLALQCGPRLPSQSPRRPSMARPSAPRRRRPQPQPACRFFAFGPAFAARSFSSSRWVRGKHHLVASLGPNGPKRASDVTGAR